jgi:hypothetical protein
MAMMPVSMKWIKSTYCADHTCLEAALLEGDVIAVRDGKNIEQPHLSFARDDWNAFLDSIVAGGHQFH